MSFLPQARFPPLQSFDKIPATGGVHLFFMGTDLRLSASSHRVLPRPSHLDFLILDMCVCEEMAVLIEVIHYVVRRSIFLLSPPYVSHHCDSCMKMNVFFPVCPFRRAIDSHFKGPPLSFFLAVTFFFL